MLESIKKLLFPNPQSRGEDTTQTLINIKNIDENIIINNSSEAMMIIGIEAIPRELLSEREQAIQASKIIAELNSEILPYRLIKVQGAVDISNITNALLSLKAGASEKRKLLINEEVEYLDKRAMENSALTPQFYITVWDKASEKDSLKRRARDMTEKYKKAGIEARILGLKEIVYFLTLYTDPVAASVEQDLDSVIKPVKASVMNFSTDDGEEKWEWN